MIYFIRCEPDGPVKIGWSENVTQRLQQVRPSPKAELTIIRLVDGPRWAEYWYHRQFRGLQISREWFFFDPDMMTAHHPDQEPSREYVSRSAIVHVRLSDGALEKLTARARADRRPLASLLALILEDEAIAPRRHDTHSPLKQDAHVDGLAMRVGGGMR